MRPIDQRGRPCATRPGTIPVIDPTSRPLAPPLQRDPETPLKLAYIWRHFQSYEPFGVPVRPVILNAFLCQTLPCAVDGHYLRWRSRLMVDSETWRHTGLTLGKRLHPSWNCVVPLPAIIYPSKASPQVHKLIKREFILFIYFREVH